MTDNQRKAYDYLSVFEKRSSNVRFLFERCEVQRAKVENATASLVGTEGWTGKWEGRCKITGKKIITTDRSAVRQARRVFAPIAKSRSDARSKEHMLDVLMDCEMRYEGAADALQDLADQLSEQIDRLIEPPASDVLKYTYITMYTYRQTAEVMKYSWQHVKRLHWEALEQFGKKMSPNEP